MLQSLIFLRVLILDIVRKFLAFGKITVQSYVLECACMNKGTTITHVAILGLWWGKTRVLMQF